jgi:hypothetical protein
VDKVEKEWCCIRAQAYIEEKGRHIKGQQRQQQKKKGAKVEYKRVLGNHLL